MRLQENDFDAALALGRQALAIKQRVLPPSSPDIAGSANAVGEALFRRGDAQGALEMSRLVVDTYRQAYGDGSPWMAKSLSNRGEYLVAVGRFAEALTTFQDALRRWESQLGPVHPYLAYPLTGIGVAHWKEHRPAEAIAPLERALAIREAGELDVSAVAETRFALARALWDAGRDRARARRLAATARADYQKLPAQNGKEDGKEDKRLSEIGDWLAAHGGA
jgi:tetratricopeptide (TPR) repeat protein